MSTVNPTKSRTTHQVASNVMFASVNMQELVQHNYFASVFGEVVQVIKSERPAFSKRIQVYKQSEVEPAFRSLQSLSHMESVAINMVSNEMVQMELTPTSKQLFRSESSYFIAGAFGGIG